MGLENQTFARAAFADAGLDSRVYRDQRGPGERLNLVDLALSKTPDQVAEQSLSNAIKNYASSHHLDVIRNGIRFEYRIQADGALHHLFSTEASEAGLKDADKELEQIKTSLMSGLADKYKVLFALPGEEIDNQRATAESTTRGQMIKSRAPELYELYGIYAALEKAGTSSLSADNSTGVKIYFPEDRLITDLSSLATYQRDKNDKPSIYLYKTDVSYITENDLPADQKALPFTDRQRSETMEGMIVHELGHHQLDKLGYSKTESGDKLFEEMGWVHRLEPNNQIDDWLLKGKSIDADGKNATYTYSWEGLFAKWTRWSVDKGPIDKDGHTVRAQDAQSFSEEEIRNEALVAPASWYFENPEEEYAEAFRMYKLGDESRQALQKTSPKLYAMVKDNCARENIVTALLNEQMYPVP